MRLPFFVYGTLRPGEANYTRTSHLRPAHAPAVVDGFRLYGAGFAFPYMVESGDPADVVWGDALWFPEHTYAEALETFDYIEGVPHHYLRITVEATMPASGDPVTCWAYVPRDPADIVGRYQPIAGGDWLARHIEGVTPR